MLCTAALLVLCYDDYGIIPSSASLITLVGIIIAVDVVVGYFEDYYL